MKKNVIAVFGGAFNPPTIAHINLAKQVLDKVNGIEKIIFVPVSTKYNKNNLESNIDRFNMLKKICASYKNFEVSNIELESNRQLYTIETLEILQEQNPNSKICFITGTDNLKELPTWHKIEKLLQEFKIIVLERENDNIDEIIENESMLRKYKESFIKVNNLKKIHLSSTEIREKIENKEDITNLVPEEIKEEVIILYK